MMLSRPLADWIERALPKPLFQVMERLYSPYKRWIVERLGKRIVQHLFPRGDFVILNGPFKGMRYFAMSSSSALAPKLIGSYELELQPSVELMASKRINRIIDIGCAEGYYAVGMALRFPSAKVHAFDSDKVARARCAELAALNKVEKRVQLHGFCTVEELKLVLCEQPALVICDCEGGEAILLDPEKIPALRWADALVELHEDVVPNLVQTITTRFAHTHKLTFLDPIPRRSELHSALKQLPSNDQRWALEEFRKGKMKWVCMEARSNN